MKKLSEIEKKNPFKVPENYFEEVNRRIISETGGTEQTVIHLNAFTRFRTGLLIAASIAGFLLIGYAAVRILTPEKPVQQVSEILNNLNTDSLINDIDISSLEEDASEITLSGESSGVSKNDIIDYLIQDNIELSDIYEKL